MIESVALQSVTPELLAQMSDADLAELDALLFTEQSFADTYWTDPAGFVLDAIDWPKLPKDHPTAYQLGILNALATNKREAVRGPHGLGKTALAAWVVWWFVLTRNARRVDWKVITTAGTHRQLTAFLWPEIHKWARYIRWEIVGRANLQQGAELLEQNIKLDTGHASAVASNQPGLIEGAHADSILYLFDESKSIMEEIFDAAEGAFSGAGPDTGREAYGLAQSTPGPTEGRFYAIHARKPGFEDWHATHVTLQQAIAAGRISTAWADARKRQWGEDSAIYKNRVLGEFASQQEDGVIPLAWLELAHERWLTLHESGALALGDGSKKSQQLTAIGVDVHGGGADKTVAALRRGNAILQLRRYQIANNSERERWQVVVAAKVQGIVRAHSGIPVVDVVGVGAGAFNNLREQKVHAIGFVAGAKAIGPSGQPLKDSSKELEFVDLRSAAWWYLRELLSPTSGVEIAIPPDSALGSMGLEDPEASLDAELLAPRWETRAGGRIKVESKDDIRERLKRSTDYADTIVQAFAADFLRAAQGMALGIGDGVSRWRM